MNKELTILLDGQEHKVFLQAGFMPNHSPAGVFHEHAHTEVHVICKGSVCFSLVDRELILDAPAMLLIPAGTYHSVARNDGGLSTAFQLGHGVAQLRMMPLDEGIVHSFVDVIQSGVSSGDYTAIHAYITLLCQLGIPSPAVTADAIHDQRFLINEFFTQNYARDVKLADLAQILNLSQRQTERLVEAYTGNSFSGELTARRMTMARLLKSTTSMPLTEIARYVGYSSYAGFWKAMKKTGAPI